MSLRFAAERLTDCWDELAPLFEPHHREVELCQDLTLRPDRARYEMVDASGVLRFYTARAAGRLVGYICFVVTPSMHYADTIAAHQDALYLAPAWRRGNTGSRFLAWADEQLRAEGVHLNFHHIPPAIDWSPLLRRLGYQDGGRLFVRRLNTHG